MTEEIEVYEEKRIGIRVSMDLYEQVLDAAKKKNMSINGFIIQALERIVDPISIESRLATLEEKVRYLTDGP